MSLYQASCNLYKASASMASLGPLEKGAMKSPGTTTFVGEAKGLSGRLCSKLHLNQGLSFIGSWHIQEITESFFESFLDLCLFGTWSFFLCYLCLWFSSCTSTSFLSSTLHPDFQQLSMHAPAFSFTKEKSKTKNDY